MSNQRDDRARLDDLQEKLDRGRKELAETEGAAEEPRFSDDGMIEKGAGTDTNAPPG